MDDTDTNNFFSEFEIEINNLINDLKTHITTLDIPKNTNESDHIKSKN